MKKITITVVDDDNEVNLIDLGDQLTAMIENVSSSLSVNVTLGSSDRVLYINGHIELEIVSDDLDDKGTITIRDPDTEEEHTIGGHEFEMEYERI